MNLQEQFWSGTEGDAYTARNRVDWRARIPFWRGIMEFTGARSVYEVGCNAGWNLSAIGEGSPHKVGLYGSDINQRAEQQARAAGLGIYYTHTGDTWLTQNKLVFDLAFSAGVLIHVSPENLEKTMLTIISASAHYVLAVEYAADVEEMIEYRGVKDCLWKRPYGKLYEHLGLRTLKVCDAQGFDRCTAWLMEIP